MILVMAVECYVSDIYGYFGTGWVVVLFSDPLVIDDPGTLVEVSGSWTSHVAEALFSTVLQEGSLPKHD